MAARGWYGLVASALLAASSGYGQQASPAPANAPAKPASKTITLTVQVTTKNGMPIPGLTQSDFSLLDNNQPREMSSFRVVTRGQEPVEAILLFDAVNTRFSNVAYERNQVEKFLSTSGGKVPIPMSVAVLTDSGAQIQNGFSTDPAVLDQGVQHAATELREINRSAGFWGATERLDISLRAIQQVAQYAGTLPGRKLVFWLSPGWPLLSGPEMQLDNKQQAQIFSTIVMFSKAMREGHVTLYSLDPLGADESLLREDYYQAFLRGISKPSQTDLGDLAVQVLALQSGGTALNSTDIGGMLRKSITDGELWYEISFESPTAEQPNEYHHLQVKVNTPGAVVRTRDGYYDQP